MKGQIAPETVGGGRRDKFHLKPLLVFCLYAFSLSIILLIF